MENNLPFFKKLVILNGKISMEGNTNKINLFEYYDISTAKEVIIKIQENTLVMEVILK